MQVVSGVLQASLQQAGALDVLLLVCGSEHLHGLFVDQSPEVLEGDVLPALDAHLLQNLSQTFLVLQTLKQEAEVRASPRGDSQELRAETSQLFEFMRMVERLVLPHESVSCVDDTHDWRMSCDVMRRTFATPGS